MHLTCITAPLHGVCRTTTLLISTGIEPTAPWPKSARKVRWLSCPSIPPPRIREDPACLNMPVLRSPCCARRDLRPLLPILPHSTTDLREDSLRPHDPCSACQNSRAPAQNISSFPDLARLNIDAGDDNRYHRHADVSTGQLMPLPHGPRYVYLAPIPKSSIAAHEYYETNLHVL